MIEKITFVESEVNEMKDFFQDKSSDINKCIRFIEKSIRHRKDIPCILSDSYYYMNTFEQIFIISQEYDMDDYYGLDIYINGTEEQAYDSVSDEDKFTLNHNYFEVQIDQITKGFENYCCTYSNQKIRRVLYD